MNTTCVGPGLKINAKTIYINYELKSHYTYSSSWSQTKDQQQYIDLHKKSGGN